MFPVFRSAIVVMGLCLSLAPAMAQETQIALGGMRADTSLPVEMTSDSLSLNQSDGSATFTGNVVIVQGELRLAAAEVQVRYMAGDGAAKGRIDRLLASGGVTLATGAEAAEAQDAEYSIDSGTVVLTGGVLLTQGPNTISGDKLTLNLKDGTGAMEGRVKTVLGTSGGN